MTKQKITFKTIAPEQISDDSMVTYYSTPYYDEIVFSENHSNKSVLSKTSPINSEHLSKQATNKIRDGTAKISSHKSMDSFKNSYKDLCRYIKGYFIGDISERHITLTYSSIMTDTTRLSNDFKAFFKKLKRRYGQCTYIYVREPQKTGSWHLHCLIKRLDNKNFNISEEVVRKLWKHGYAVSVKKIYDIAGLCRYFNISNNKYKSNRIIFYPKDLRLFEHSRNISIKQQRLLYGDIKKMLEDKKLVFEKSQEIILSDKDNHKAVINKTKYEQYKK